MAIKKPARDKGKETGRTTWRSLSQLRRDIDRDDDVVIAIFGSDWHNRHQAPSCRSQEPDWYLAQQRVCMEVGEVYESFDPAPFIFAGDLLHHWNEPAELINFLLKNLPNGMYCITGQHDMPLHQEADMHKSAYQTLVQAEKINDLMRTKMIMIPTVSGVDLRIFPFPWGRELKKNPMTGTSTSKNKQVNVALIHQYAWLGEHGFTGAPDEGNVSNIIPKVKGYDLVVFGDNHNAFAASDFRINKKLVKDAPAILNCGCMMRQSTTELNYQPSIWLYTLKGNFYRYLLDTSKDVISADVKDKSDVKMDRAISALGANLTRLAMDCCVDFAELIAQTIKSGKLKPETKKVLQEILEEVYNEN